MKLILLILALQMTLAQPLGALHVPINTELALRGAPPIGTMIANVLQQKEQNEFESTINSIVQKHTECEPFWGENGVLGFYVKELNTGLEGGYNSTKLDKAGLGFFQTASTVKLMMGSVMAYMDQHGELDLDCRIYDLVTNCEYNLRDITRIMITHSMNDYFNILLRLVGVDRTNAILHELGATDSHIFCELQPGAYVNDTINMKRYGTTKAPRTTPRDLGFLLELIYSKAYGEDNSEFLKRALLDCIYDTRIPRSIDWESPVAHKTGSHSHAFNDAGIVYLEGNPYIIVLMSYFVNKKANLVLRAVSKDIYELEKKRNTISYPTEYPLLRRLHCFEQVLGKE